MTIALVALGIAIGLWTHLARWAGTGQPANDGGVTMASTQHHELSETIVVDYRADDSAVISVDRTAMLRPTDGLSSHIEDGSINQQYAAYFNNLFTLTFDGNADSESDSLVTYTATSSSLTARDSTVYNIDKSNSTVILGWWADDSAGDSSTVSIRVRGGVIAGAIGAPEPMHSDTSITWSATAHVRSISLAVLPNGASPAQMPAIVNGFYQMPDPSSPTSTALGSLAEDFAAAVAAMMLVLPVLCLVGVRRTGILTFMEVPRLVLVLLSVLAAVASSVLWGHGSFQVRLMWECTAISVTVLGLCGWAKPFGFEAVFKSWVVSIATFFFIAAAVVAVFVPGSSSHPESSLALTAVLLAAALALNTSWSWRFRPRLMISWRFRPRLTSILVPCGFILFMDNESPVLSFNRASVINWIAESALCGAILAITGVALVLALIGRERSGGSQIWILLLAGAAGTPLFSLDASGTHWSDAPDAALAAILAACFFADLAVLRRNGAGLAGVRGRGARYVTVGLLAIVCSGYGWVPPWWAGLSAVVAAVGAHVLLPRSRTRQALKLAAVGPRAHQEHILALQQARTRVAVDRRYHRDSADAIADEKLEMDEYRDVSRRLRRESINATSPQRAELALGTLAGDSPWRSGLAGLGMGAVIGAPFMITTVAQAPESTWSAFTTGSIAGLVIVIVHTARWAVYGLVYGYFYANLRGRSAFPKALWFAAVMLPAELANPWLTHKPSSVIEQLGLDTVQLLAFAAVLALAWEVRQARRAGVNWDAVRDLRSLRALAAPASALLLAIVTAAATTLASTEIPNWVGPQQTPAPQTSLAPTAHASPNQ